VITEVKKSARRIAEVLLAVAILVSAVKIYGHFREKQGRAIGAIESESAQERQEIEQMQAEADGAGLYRRAIRWIEQ